MNMQNGRYHNVVTLKQCSVQKVSRNKTRGPPSIVRLFLKLMAADLGAKHILGNVIMQTFKLFGYEFGSCLPLE